MMLLKRLPVLFGVFLIWTSGALAQACVGVEARVNVRTGELTAAVTANIAARTAALNAQELVERQRLLSALSVFTRQLSVSGQQEVMAEEAASRGVAQTIVQQSVNDQIRAAVDTYGNTGYNPCGTVELGHQVASALNDAAAARDAIANVVAERHDGKTIETHRALLNQYAQLSQNSDDLTAEALFGGTDEEAEDFITLALGAPRAPVGVNAGGIAQRLDRVSAMQDLALKSVSAIVMADVAASQRVDAALREMTGQWTGAENAEAWAARQAVSSSRGVLLDTARIEAANLAMAANALRRDYMEEFALAGFALSYANNMGLEQ